MGWSVEAGAFSSAKSLRAVTTWSNRIAAPTPPSPTKLLVHPTVVVVVVLVVLVVVVVVPASASAPTPANAFAADDSAAADAADTGVGMAIDSTLPPPDE